MVQNFKIMPTIPLHLGWTPYWSMLPLQSELERLGGAEIEFHKGSPVQVNRWLSEGKVALAPSSSVCLVKNSQHEIAFPLGVASCGPVLSAYIGVHHEETGVLEVIRTRQAMLREILRQAKGRPENDARKLASFLFKMSATLPPLELDVPPPMIVTPASATGANLARLLYRLWFGESAYEMRAAETGGAAATTALSLRRPIEVLVGDEALQRRPSFRAVIDLGEAWRDLTDLPFVFAIFQTTRKTLSPYWRQKILEAAELAQARMRVEPSYYLPERGALDVNARPIDLVAYWKAIQYRLGPQHFKGLALFLALSRLLSPDSIDDQAVANITRWESLAANSASLI